MSRAPVVRAEAGDRAVHDSPGNARRPDAEALGDAGTERLDDDVRTRAQRRPEPGVARAVPDDRLLARVERCIPLRRDVPERIAVGCLEPYDPRTEAQELAARERAGKVAREVDDESAGERLHYAQYVD